MSRIDDRHVLLAVQERATPLSVSKLPPLTSQADNEPSLLADRPVRHFEHRSWNREALAYLIEANRVVWRQIGQRGMPFTDDERRRLATRATGIIAFGSRPWTFI